MHEDNCAVYVHVNLINGKKYFGITTQNPPENRWRNGNGYIRNTHLTNAIKKYSWDNFGHYVLYRNIPIKIAKNIEEMLIREHMSYDPRFGYNLTRGGEFERRTKETREKISKNNSMKRPEVRAKIMGENNPTKRPEVRAKMRAAKPKKEVEAINPETGERVYYFESGRDAERAGFNHGAISNCCNGKWKTHHGYIWRFVEEVNKNDGNN